MATNSRINKLLYENFGMGRTHKFLLLLYCLGTFFIAKDAKASDFAGRVYNNKNGRSAINMPVTLTQKRTGLNENTRVNPYNDWGITSSLAWQSGDTIKVVVTDTTPPTTPDKKDSTYVIWDGSGVTWAPTLCLGGWGAQVNLVKGNLNNLTSDSAYAKICTMTDTLYNKFKIRDGLGASPYRVAFDVTNINPPSGPPNGTQATIKVRADTFAGSVTGTLNHARWDADVIAESLNLVPSQGFRDVAITRNTVLPETVDINDVYQRNASIKNNSDLRREQGFLILTRKRTNSPSPKSSPLKGEDFSQQHNVLPPLTGGNEREGEMVTLDSLVQSFSLEPPHFSPDTAFVGFNNWNVALQDTGLNIIKYEVVPTDSQPSNNTRSETTFVGYKDAQPISIIAPTGQIVIDSGVVPRARIRNNGSLRTDSIKVVFTISETKAKSLRGNEMTGTRRVDGAIATSTISNSNTLEIATLPKQARNDSELVGQGFSLANNQADLKVCPTLNNGEYCDTVIIPNLNARQEIEVVFDEYVASTLGIFNTEVLTILPEDAILDNDILTGSGFEVVNPPQPPGWHPSVNIPSNVTGKNVKDGGALVSVRDSIYAFRGNKANEFYLYDGSGWTLKESLPYGRKPTDPYAFNKKKVSKGASLCFDGLSTIYATKGNGTKEFWMYDITNNIWSAKAFITVPKALKGGTSIVYKDSKVYLLAGGQKPTDPSNFYCYNTSTNEWTQATAVLFGPTYKPWKDGSCITEMDGKIYALKGGDKVHYFCAYDTSTQTWTSDSIPEGDSLYGKWKKVKVKDGAAMTSGDGAIYAIKGGGANVFWQYTATGSWARLESIPRQHKKSVPKTGAALAYANNAVWLLKGNNTPEFWQYTPSIATLKGCPTLFANSVEQGFSRANENGTLPTTANTGQSFSFTNKTIRYTVPVTGKVSIKLYNTTGRLVETLINEYRNNGSYSFKIQNSKFEIPAGVYFLRYDINNNQDELKIILY